MHERAPDVAINYFPTEEPDAQQVIELIKAEGRSLRQFLVIYLTSSFAKSWSMKPTGRDDGPARGVTPNRPAAILVWLVVSAAPR
jgi:hypothetical protein